MLLYLGSNLLTGESREENGWPVATDVVCRKELGPLGIISPFGWAQRLLSPQYICKVVELVPSDTGLLRTAIGVRGLPS